MAEKLKESMKEIRQEGLPGMVSPTDPFEGRILEGRYQILQKLGVGGTADVYLALQQPIGREVAIKILRSDLRDSQDPDRGKLAERLLREARMIARLSHPNIVHIHDFGTLPDGAVYLVMERVSGRPLTSLLGRPMEPMRAARIALAVADALGHAHAQGIIHRDIKPSNVLITVSPADRDVPRLLDFGIGKEMDGEETTLVGRFLGTPQYASPEQATGVGPIDGRSDLYALGCMLYRMLAGTLPFEADTIMGIAYKQVHAPYPPIQTRADVQVDPALEEIVAACMAKDPADRPADAAALIARLDGWLQRAERHARQDALQDASGLPRPPPPPAYISAATLLPAAADSQDRARPAEPRPARAPLRWLLPVALAAGLGWMLWPAPPSPVAETPPGLSEPDVDLSGATITDAPADAPAASPAASPAVAAGPSAAPPSAPVIRPATAKSAPEAKPAPATAKPAPATGAGRMIDGVWVEAATEGRVLAWVNRASESELKAAGIYTRGVNIILEKRPFSSLESFAQTPYLGTKSLQAAVDAVRR